MSDIGVPDSPPASSTSSSTESFTSESSFISAASTTESVKEVSPDKVVKDIAGGDDAKASDDPDDESEDKFVDPQVPRSDVIIDYSQWLEALFIALKYKKGLSPDLIKSEKNGGEADPASEDGADDAGSGLTSLTRYYTCPLDQVRRLGLVNHKL